MYRGRRQGVSGIDIIDVGAARATPGVAADATLRFSDGYRSVLLGSLGFVCDAPSLCDPVQETSKMMGDEG